MPDLPTGTVTFLYTDIEGSTRLWERHPDAMRRAVDGHLALLRDAVVARGGVVFRTVGDGLCAAFAVAPQAVAAALAAQQALLAEPWEETGLLRVRMALHTGAAAVQGGDYVGACLNRLGRLLAAGHGGQALLSQATAELVREALPEGAGLRDLGEQRLRDLERAEHVYQLVHPSLPADFSPLQSLDAARHNLPLQLTSFVGREQELGQIKQELERARLLTLTGVGGCGKTRLALQVAAELLERYPDGVWLVELAPLADPALLPGAIAAALGVREAPGQTILETLLGVLRDKRLLLVLDNCEHLLDACAHVADALLRRCPGVQLLATSREALGIAGEVSWRVPSLAIPTADAAVSLDALLRCDAVRLFIDRALAVQPAFQLTNQNAPAVAQICARLDGIPLAIELAGARVRMLPPEQLLARLEDRFRLLTGGSRTALERHQTLQAAVDWSYALLTEPERLLLNRLSVFAGGWTLEAAEAVCAGDGIESWDVLDVLTRLADKSLAVVGEQRDSTARYGLLETLRQYTRQHLSTSGEAEAMHERHAAYFIALANQVGGPHVEVPASWLDVMDREVDNVRAALRWLVEHGPHDAALRLAYQAARLWGYRGNLAEGLARLREVLALPATASPTSDRAFALFWASIFARYSGDRAAAHAFGKESLACSQAIGDQRGAAYATGYVGLVFQEEGDYQAALSWHERALALHREVSDEAGAASELDRIAQAVNALGDAREARRLHEQALTIRRRLGTVFGLGWSLAHVGDLAADRDDYDLARSLYAESLTVVRRVAYQPIVAKALEGLAAVAAANANGERALRLLGAATVLHETAGARMPPADQARVQRVTARARACARPAAADAAWSAGRAMPREEAIAYALEDAPEGTEQTSRPA